VNAIKLCLYGSGTDAKVMNMLTSCLSPQFLNSQQFFFTYKPPFVFFVFLLSDFKSQEGLSLQPLLTPSGEGKFYESALIQNIGDKDIDKKDY
jgi:hypothetical protein